MRPGNDIKRCPFFQKECLQNQCMIYHEEFARCKFDLIIYNMYKLERTMAAAIPPGQQPGQPWRAPKA